MRFPTYFLKNKINITIAPLLEKADSPVVWIRFEYMLSDPVAIA